MNQYLIETKIINFESKTMNRIKLNKVLAFQTKTKQNHYLPLL